MSIWGSLKESWHAAGVVSDSISEAQKARPEPQTASQAVNQGIDDGFAGVTKVGLHIASPLIGWLTHQWTKDISNTLAKQTSEAPINTPVVKPYKSEPGHKF